MQATQIVQTAEMNSRTAQTNGRAMGGPRASHSDMKPSKSSQLGEFAQLDVRRKERIGIAEAVYAPGKTPQQCADIVSALLAELDGAPGPVLLSRPDESQAAAVLEACPDGEVRERLIFWNPLPQFAVGRTSEEIAFQSTDTEHTALHSLNGSINSQADQTASQSYLTQASQPQASKIVIATAGTGDLPPARECQAVLEAYGIAAELICDVGVAGIHRTLGAADQFQDAAAVVVVAGMEGALASVVGGLTPAPIIAVPSSVGYGSSLEGVTALLAMLSSCAPGVTVVGIDNGFGAACAVLRLLRADRSASVSRSAPANNSASASHSAPADNSTPASHSSPANHSAFSESQP